MNNQKGSAVVLGVIIMLTFGIMLAGLVPWINSLVRQGPINQDTLGAQYAAEAGAKRAVVEFNKANASKTTDFTWLNSDHPLTNDVNSAKYNVLIYESTDLKNPVTPNFTSNHNYVIQSTGTVGKVKKVVTVTIQVISGGNGGSGNGSLFSKYALFSNGPLEIDNNPHIAGDIASNSTITVNSSSPLIYGTAYTPYVPQMNQGTWNKNAVTGGYTYANPAGTLDVSSLFPTMPSLTATGTDLSTVKNGTLSGGSYYYNGSYLMNNDSLVVNDDQNVTIYINGDLHLTQNSLISGGNVTIYVTGSILLDNTSSIQTKNLTLYSKGNIQLTNYSTLTANTVTIQTNGSINFNSYISINKNSSTAVNKIYANGNIEFTNNFEMDGIAGLVVSKSPLQLNSNILAQQTIFVSGSGSSEVTNIAKIGAIYTNGSLNINTSPTISFGNSKDDIMKALGFSGTSILVQNGSWTAQ